MAKTAHDGRPDRSKMYDSPASKKARGEKEHHDKHPEGKERDEPGNKREGSPKAEMKREEREPGAAEEGREPKGEREGVENATHHHERHAAERSEMHDRHRREMRDMHGNHRAEHDKMAKRHMDEIGKMNERHADEMTAGSGVTAAEGGGASEPAPEVQAA